MISNKIGIVESLMARDYRKTTGILELPTFQSTKRERLKSTQCSKSVLQNIKQAGNGPSRRHIQGSKIAKGLQSVKYSLLQYTHEEKIEKNRFFQFFVR